MKRVTFIIEAAEKGSDEWQVWLCCSFKAIYPARVAAAYQRRENETLQFRIIKRTEEVVR